MLNDPFETLKKVVNQPSGSRDKEDVTKVAAIFAEEFEGLGFNVETIPGVEFGPKLVCTIGSGEKNLMLMGHMDTVFPHDLAVPYTDMGDGTIRGSGIIDMKGGIVVMLYALKEALPKIDLNRYRLTVVLNPDEEIGSLESRDIILENAKKAFAALSFEPSSTNGRVTSARKGVTSVIISCTGIAGHAGNRYKECASATQALCAQITKLYTLRDDARDISFNAGTIHGGTAENVVAAEAVADCEFRYYNEAYKAELMQKITALCADEPVPGAHTTVKFGASHPACDVNPKSQALIDLAQKVGAELGREVPHERTGGAGDIAIAALAGIGVLDGFGTSGTGMHSVEETCIKASVPKQIALASAMLQAVCC